MKYALKISRETNSSIIRVHPIEEVPDTCKPYRTRRRTYYVESLQVFKTRAAANTARAMEIVAAEYAQKTPNELRGILRRDIGSLANLGITMETMCRFTNESSGTLNTYLASTKRISPRIVAKFHIVAGHLRSLANFGNTILPADGGCGATHMGNGGNREIWKLHREAARAKKPEQFDAPN